MNHRMYFNADGTPALHCPFAKLDFIKPACNEFGTTDDPEKVLDHIVAHHDARYVARAFMHLEVLHDEVMTRVETLNSQETEAPADQLFGPPTDDNGAILPG